MPKVTVIPQQVGQQLLPISVNQDGSITATVSFGLISQIELPNGEKQNNFAVQSQNSLYIQADEAKAVFETVANKGETLDELLERAVGDVLRAKGILQA